MSVNNDCTVWDLDGTLADHQHRVHHLAKRPRDFESYYARMGADTPKTPWTAVAVGLMSRMPGHIATGRPERYRHTSNAWLAREINAPYHTLLMRTDGDYRPNDLIKLDQARTLIDRGWRIRAWFDDNPNITGPLSELGILVITVPGWDPGHTKAQT